MYHILCTKIDLCPDKWPGADRSESFHKAVMGSGTMRVFSDMIDVLTAPRESRKTIQFKGGLDNGRSQPGDDVF
ncbi:hypothetical protein CEXT_420751 [Caerostris extrusa]|uniref:Uncharacterized protein n=1 Tax=Caerostris extrusa TaxID=172846 RepID=A0AAV4P1H6_CAEEX|nr:hypothetical protein CEXT_420751 [Caerostris extrusa]